MLEQLEIARTSTAAQVAEAVQDALMRGELTPGSRISESGLAEQLKISRNTVREAMRILERGGLVHHEVNRGAVVKAMEMDEVEDLYRVREMLERQAIDTLTRKTDLAGIEATLGALEGAFRAGDISSAVECDLLFHASIVALIGSPHIDRFFAELRDELRFCLAVLSVEDRETERPEELIAQHTVIMDALRDRDRRRAKELATAHVRANRERATQLLRAREQRVDAGG
jgi:DNA-binding GntR family transcriptional regulator